MSTEAMKLALEALEDISALQNHSDSVDSSDVDKAITTLQEELAQQQEPVAWRVKWPAIGGGYKWLMVDKPLMEKEGFVNEALYTSPPARKPLTDEEMNQIEARWDASMHGSKIAFVVRETEAAHQIGVKK